MALVSGKEAHMSAAMQKRSRDAVALVNFAPSIMGEAFRKNGFLNYHLIANWREIAGPALASVALPLKLTGATSARTANRSARDAGDSPKAATLFLKVEPARSLEAQYQVPQLIDRINACLGYRAISAIRMVQAPLSRAPRRKNQISQRVNIALPLQFTSADGTRLDRALARLNASRAARGGAN
jgi:hypothetical protein